MDLPAVKAASVPLLANGAVAAAANVLGLVEDAEVLAIAGRQARAYSLAVLAVEELGKAGSLTDLAAMPESVREQAPLARMLEWHQLKLLKGTLLATMGVAPTAVCPTLAKASVSDVAEILDGALATARDEDCVRLRGLYVDVDQGGRVQQPSQVTADQVGEQLDRARLAASVACELLDPGAADRIVNPDPTTVDFSRAQISAFGVMGRDRGTDAAADVLLDAARQACSTASTPAA